MGDACASSRVLLALTAAAATLAGGAHGQEAAPFVGQGATAYGVISPLLLYAPQGMVASGYSVNGPLFRDGRSNKASCGGGPRTGRDRPRVVSTFPAQGAVVSPGVVVVRVTFDRPMSCEASFAGASDAANPCPSRWREVTLSRDLRSFRAVCEVKANTRYELPVRSFRSTSNVLAEPTVVTFTTAGAAAITTVRQALAEDVGGQAIEGG